MSARVRHKTEIISPDDVRTGFAPRGKTWRAVGRNVNHLLGRGSVLIPQSPFWAYDSEFGGILRTITAGGSVTLRAFLNRRAATLRRLWVLHLTAADSGADYTFTDFSGGSSSGPVPATDASDQTAVITHIEEVSSPSAGKTSDTATLAVTGQTVTVHSIGVYALPRGTLDADATEYGVETGTLAGEQPIYEPATYAGRSMDVVRGIEAARDIADRPCLFHAWIDSVRPLEVSSTSFVNVFDLPIILLPRYLSDTTPDVDIRVFAGMEQASSAAEIHFTSSLPDGATLNVSSTSFSWLSGTLTVAAEDPDGTLGGSPSTVQVEARRTSGTGAVQMSSFTIMPA